MTLSCKLLVALVLLSVATAQPSYLNGFGNNNQLERRSDSGVDADVSPSLDFDEIQPELYLIIAEAADDDENIDGPVRALPRNEVKKRSAEAVDDLETAAGTNVLRPLFVYRQQLAYRERIKSGSLRRVGIRPRF